ncbi:MAG: substrate-binding domain-containing protein [Gammaproteobacteria bacterium]|nr:substrate-binding domain-containing protein [Gammaproteobacteria bacterium]
MNKIITIFFGLVLGVSVRAEVILASTTSAQNSGLYDYLIPLIEEHIHDSVKVIAVGTGQALRLGENGDADILIVHAPEKEKEFISLGFGMNRQQFMYNNFLIVGSADDPARVQSSQTAREAFDRIQTVGKEKKTNFVSRGDDSGTHVKELSLWKNSPANSDGSWYLESGSGMGATLNIAIANEAYTLSDSSTWLSYKNKQNSVSLFAGDPVLFNQYSVILIPPKRHPHVNAKKAQAIADWLTSKEGQQAINSFTINGEQAFFANAQAHVK